MGNRIREIGISNGRLDPFESEFWIRVFPELVTSTTEVHGRVMGPRCVYTSTVEIAYPLRESLRTDESAADPHLTLRVILPEACFWEPETPFLYEGPLELWHNGQLCDRAHLSHGLRRVKLGPKGLRVNGRLLPLNAISRAQFTEADLRPFHQAGVNTLLVPVDDATEAVCAIADRLGFFVLGKIAEGAKLQFGKELAQHPSFLGWVLDSRLLHDPLALAVTAGELKTNGPLFGIELTEKPPLPLPAHIDFLVCSETSGNALADIRLPRLSLRKAAFRGNLDEEAMAAGTFGWIYQE